MAESKSQGSIYFSRASDSQRQFQSKSSSDFDAEEIEQVYPLGGSYVPQSGRQLSNRKFEFLHLQRQKQRLAQLNINNQSDLTEFENIIRQASEILNVGRGQKQGINSSGLSLPTNSAQTNINNNNNGSSNSSSHIYDNNKNDNNLDILQDQQYSFNDDSDAQSINRQFWQAKDLMLEHSAMQRQITPKAVHSENNLPSPLFNSRQIRKTASLEQLLKQSSENQSSRSQSEASRSIIQNENRVEIFIHDLLKSEAYDKVQMPLHQNKRYSQKNQKIHHKLKQQYQEQQTPEKQQPENFDFVKSPSPSKSHKFQKKTRLFAHSLKKNALELQDMKQKYENIKLMMSKKLSQNIEKNQSATRDQTDQGTHLDPTSNSSRRLQIPSRPSSKSFSERGHSVQSLERSGKKTVGANRIQPACFDSSKDQEETLTLDIDLLTSQPNSDQQQRLSTSFLEQNYLGAPDNWVELETPNLKDKKLHSVALQRTQTIEAPQFGALQEQQNYYFGSREQSRKLSINSLDSDLELKKSPEKSMIEQMKISPDKKIIKPSIPDIRMTIDPNNISDDDSMYSNRKSVDQEMPFQLDQNDNPFYSSMKSQREANCKNFISEYATVIQEEHKNKSNKFVKNFWEKKKTRKHKILQSLKCIDPNKVLTNSVDYKNMTSEEKKLRIKFLWFKVRQVYNAMVFIACLRDKHIESEQAKETNINYEMILADDEEHKVDERKITVCCWMTLPQIIFVWQILMSFAHWYNLLTVPALMLWPELFPPPDKSLWLLELFFAMDMVVSCIKKKKKSFAVDSYDIFVEYLRSNFILDVIVIVPNTFSGLNPAFSPLKFIRIYEIEMLHFTGEQFYRWLYFSKSKSEKDNIVYAISILTKIMILLHYLAFLWMYIGGPDFLDYEQGRLPWTYANSDFEGYTQYQLYIFSTYWVFTVITTVGYGDYSGGTTLEYEVSLFFESFGLAVFTLLQMTVMRVVSSKYNFHHYIDKQEQLIDQWLLKLEMRCQPFYMPSAMFTQLRQKALASITNDFNMIIEEYGFWVLCTDKDQFMIINFLFGDIVKTLEPICHECEQGFISNFVVSFAYRRIHAGQVVQFAEQEVFEMFIVWEGSVAITEATEYEEPILVYNKGTIFNLYQIMMDCDLPFNYRAVWPDEYTINYRTGKATFNHLHQQRKTKISFNEHRFKPCQFPLQQKDVLLYAVEKDRLEELFEMYPKAEEAFEQYCIQQVEYLRKVRKKGDHFCQTVRKDYDFSNQGKREPFFFNKPTDKDDLDFEILHKKEATQEERMYELVKKINKKMKNLQKSMETSIKQKIPTNNYNRLKRAETFLSNIDVRSQKQAKFELKELGLQHMHTCGSIGLASRLKTNTLGMQDEEIVEIDETIESEQLQSEDEEVDLSRISIASNNFEFESNQEVRAKTQKHSKERSPTFNIQLKAATTES